MCDFTQYGGKSEEWLRLEKELPPPPDGLSQDELQRTANQAREDASKKDMKDLSAQIYLQEHSISTRDGHTLEARSYRPSYVDPTTILPTVLYFHAGGFFFGSLSSDHSICAHIAIDTGSAVLKVSYSHTPRWTYPTAFIDSDDAGAWLQLHASEFGGDATNVVITGTSAGGQLTYSLVQRLFHEKDPTRTRVKSFVPMLPCVVLYGVYQPYLEKLKSKNVSSYAQNEYCPI